MNKLIATGIIALLAAPVYAGGDVAKGEKTFKKCKSCHTIVADDGTVIVKGGKVGPNLYGLPGRVVGSTDYKYSAALKAVGEAGTTWDEAAFAEYVKDPKKWARKQLDDSKAKVKMTYKLKKGAEDVYAYLESIVPAE